MRVPNYLWGGFLFGAVVMAAYQKMKAKQARPYTGPVPPVIPVRTPPLPKRRPPQLPANWRN